MKLSVSLSDSLESPLRKARKGLGNLPVSLLLEAALTAYLDLTTEAQAQVVQRCVADRAAVTRSGWSRSFWQLLGARMEFKDLQENELAPRLYGGHIVVMLLPAYDRYAAEDEDFIVHATPSDSKYSGRSTWTFERGVPPSVAAHTVADWLKMQRALGEG